MRRTAIAIGFAAGLFSAATAQASDFKITASDVADGERLNMAQVLNGFGCKGGNVSPRVEWQGAPAGTKSLALTLYDPDAPTGSGWWHWVVFNIPAETTEMPRGAGDPTKGLMPKGAVQSRTDFGKPGFGGACPPEGHGMHHYQLTVHALDIDKLQLDENASAAMVGFNLSAHRLGQARVTGLYDR